MIPAVSSRTSATGVRILTIGVLFRYGARLDSGAPDAKHGGASLPTTTCSRRNPAPRQPTPWHQDQPYYNIEGRQNVSFWIPVDPVSRASDPGVRRRIAPRPMADAAVVHGRAGQVVSRRQPRGSTRHRSKPKRLPDSRLGTRTGRSRVFPHADAARGAGSRRTPSPAGFFRCAFWVTTSPTRRGDGRHLPEFLRPRGRAAAGRSHEPFPVSGIVAEPIRLSAVAQVCPDGP